MGRLDGNSTPNNHPGQSQFQLAHPTGQQVEEYGFTPVTQAPETIDDAPPAYEFGNEETQRENSQNVPPEKQQTRPSNTMNTGLENQIQQKSQPPAQRGEAVTFPPTSAPQAVQFPPQNAQIPATRSTISGIPPQVSPQAFPPPEAFPPEKPGAFPPPGTDQMHGFPPHQGEPVHFPPHQPAFQQPHMAQFTPATNHSFPAANMNASMGSQGIPGSPFGQNAHMVNNFPQAGIPVQAPMFKPPTELWTSTLFDCMNDPENALITACFPCVTFGQIAEILDQGQTSCGTSGCLYGMIAFCIAMPCLMSCGYRTKLRNQLGLIESPAPDWVVHCFCEWCALCQEYRELKLRGLDPAIGWQGNAIRMQQQMATMTPPMQHMMGR